MKKKIQKTHILKVECACTEMWAVAECRPNPRNPNKHPAKQIALLAKIIQHQGWRAPIVISRRSGFVVKGHGRLEVAKFLNCEKVPVDLQDYASEADEWADMIADNKIAELAETDDQELALLLGELEGEIDMDLTGMLDKLKSDSDGAKEIQISEIFQVVVNCKNEAQQARLFSRLSKEGLNCQVLTV